LNFLSQIEKLKFNYADYMFPRNSKAQIQRNSTKIKNIILCFFLSQIITVFALIIIFLICMVIVYNKTDAISQGSTTHLRNDLQSMTGSILLYASDKEPELPWLLCNGSNVSRSRFPKLFSVIGTIYGRGDKRSTFSLPDFRKRFPLGTDALRTVGLLGGRDSHELSINELPSHSHGVGSLRAEQDGIHTHKINDPGHNHKVNSTFLKIAKYLYWGESYNNNDLIGGLFRDVQNAKFPYDDHSHLIQTDYTRITLENSGSHDHELKGGTDSVGQSNSFSLLQPFITINYVIFSD
jgi:microcystin-dependent protein